MVAATVVVASSANMVPGMTATVAGIEYGASEVEVIASRIAGIDAEVPDAIGPVQWTIEVCGGTEGIPLPFEQYVAHVKVTTLPIGAIYIIVAGDAHQVVKVNLVGGLVLLIVEVQLVGHLVGQEQGFVAGLFVTHCVACCCYRQHGGQDYHYSLHNRRCLLFTVQN